MNKPARHSPSSTNIQWLAYARLMRLDKPIGTLLVLWPLLWALWLANAGMPSLKLLIIFIVGALVMRTAGCVINDVIDRDLDKHVARTFDRPLVQGIISVRQALIVFALLMLIALSLVLQLNALTFKLACVVAALSVFYPFCKRIIEAPQLILGITFNAGILLAFSASLNQLPMIAWLLFFISSIWTVAYDTLYAMADKVDDLKIGIKSTAVLFGRFDLLITTGLFGIFFTGMLLIGQLAHLHFIYIIFVLLAALWTGRALYKARSREASVCFKAFLANNITGGLIFLGVLLAHY